LNGKESGIKLDVYPYSVDKLKTPEKSIKDIGLWPAVIGRKKDYRIQLAFGHHSIEAARRVNLKTVRIILQVLMTHCRHSREREVRLRAML